MAKMLISEDDFNGHFVIVHRNQLDGFIAKYFDKDLCRKIKNIVSVCFHNEVDIVILFLNKLSGSFTCTCFLPIYCEKDVLLKMPEKT